VAEDGFWPNGFLILAVFRYLIDHGCQPVFPLHRGVIEVRILQRLDNPEIGRQVEIAWHEQAMVADVVNLVDAVAVAFPFSLIEYFYTRQNRKTNALEGLRNVVQIARVGSPLPSDSMRRRMKAGTGGIGNR